MITITYDTTLTVEADRGIKLYQLLEQLPARPEPPLAALVNGDVQELDYPLFADSRVEWLDRNSTAGYRIYRRSLQMVLQLAMHRHFPGKQLWISHALEEGVFCRFADNTPISADDVALLETDMRALLEQKLPINRHYINRDDAIDFFRETEQHSKAALLSMQPLANIAIHSYGELSDYFFGEMPLSLPADADFSLIPFDDGFMLRLPARRFLGEKSGEFTPPLRLQKVMRERDAWLQMQDLTTVDKLNDAIRAGKTDELILIAENMYDRQLQKICDAVAADFPTVRLVLVAGPSSSGKTTTTERLAIGFRALGLQPVTIGMDNYFIDRDKTPLNEFGNPDFESIRALDLPLFNQHLNQLIAGEEVMLPRYNFTKGRRDEEGTPCRLSEKGIIIVEGIHALNELLTESVPAANKRKVYISALTLLNFDPVDPVPTSDNRMIRRMVRDMKFRGHSPEKTLAMWGDVRYGEHRNIFPYQEEADFYVNSSLIYELPLLRPLIENELAAISTESPVYAEAQRMLSFIRCFEPAVSDKVPRDSVLQEFLGGSCFNV
ncbi:MAG: nucleoside kinase [Firmicutes bacterium]|nr:nucleoside kinase [Bacillota bacterium]